MSSSYNALPSSTYQSTWFDYTMLHAMFHCVGPTKPYGLIIQCSMVLDLQTSMDLIIKCSMVLDLQTHMAWSYSAQWYWTYRPTWTWSYNVPWYLTYGLPWLDHTVLNGTGTKDAHGTDHKMLHDTGPIHVYGLHYTVLNGTTPTDLHGLHHTMLHDTESADLHGLDHKMFHGTRPTDPHGFIIQCSMVLDLQTHKAWSYSAPWYWTYRPTWAWSYSAQWYWTYRPTRLDHTVLNGTGPTDPHGLIIKCSMILDL
jgi:hypothetical protein